MKKFTLAVAVTAILVLSGNTYLLAQRITLTIAGTGVAGYSGDNGAAKFARIGGPKDVCLDAAENIYFVEKANGLVRRIDAITGVITTIAGGGTSTADGVSALSTSIVPNYMCIDAAGDIFITTTNQVRMIDAATGLISTIAGTGTAGYSGDGGPAIAAMLNNPQGVAIDLAGNIYVVDRNNNRIRKITGSTGTISTIAGTGVAGNTGEGGPAPAAMINAPVCVCVNAAGDVFFSDQNPHYPAYDNSIIRKISGLTGIVTRIAGVTSGGVGVYGVPAMTATLGTTTGMCIGPSGNLYCNEMSCSCREVDFTTGTLNRMGGDFSIQSYSDDLSSPLSNMNIPYGLCVDHVGNIYVADSNNQRIRKLIKLTSTPTFAFGEGMHINPITGSSCRIDSLLWITDLDPDETETWTVISGPMYGTLTGFPASAVSNGTVRSTKPTAITYIPSAGYPGSDMIRVRVSDGLLSDTITIYIGAILDPVNEVINDFTGYAPVLSVGNEDNALPRVSIYPNPATSFINVQWDNVSTESSTVIITDVTDRVFYHTKLSGNRKNSGAMQINTTTFPPGVYVIRMDDLLVQKFVKQ
jgi:sugar lactone lactonase YvrE